LYESFNRFKSAFIPTTYLESYNSNARNIAKVSCLDSSLKVKKKKASTLLD
jgi:hypothetical protein